MLSTSLPPTIYVIKTLNIVHYDCLVSFNFQNKTSCRLPLFPRYVICSRIETLSVDQCAPLSGCKVVGPQTTRLHFSLQAEVPSRRILILKKSHFQIRSSLQVRNTIPTKNLGFGPITLTQKLERVLKNTYFYRYIYE